jgi:hypothetical protein
MDESRVLERLGRIDALDRSCAAPGELLSELRGLLREAEELARVERIPSAETEEVIGRLRTARARDIIGM